MEVPVCSAVDVVEVVVAAVVAVREARSHRVRTLPNRCA